MTKNQSRVGLLLALAAVLLVAAFALSRCAGGANRGGTVIERHAKPIAYPRQRPRKARAAATAADAGLNPAERPAAPVDRVQRALPAPGKDGAIVVEVNAIRHSPLAEKIIACESARRGDAALGLSTLSEELGIDVSEDVDRIGIDRNVVVASGFFENLKVPAELGPGEGYGDTGRLYVAKDEADKPLIIGRVGTDLLMTGSNIDDVKASIDRVEGRTAPGASFPEGLADGSSDIYGILGPALLAELGSDAAPLADKIASGTVRMAVDDAAALSLDLQATSPAQAADIGKAIGGALSLARTQAQDEGEADLAALLEQAEVNVDDHGTIAVDVAVPGATLLRILGCDPDGHPLPDTATKKPGQGPG